MGKATCGTWSDWDHYQHLGVQVSTSGALGWGIRDAVVRPCGSIPLPTGPFCVLHIQSPGPFLCHRRVSTARHRHLVPRATVFSVRIVTAFFSECSEGSQRLSGSQLENKGSGLSLLYARVKLSDAKEKSLPSYRPTFRKIFALGSAYW